MEAPPSSVDQHPIDFVTAWLHSACDPASFASAWDRTDPEFRRGWVDCTDDIGPDHAHWPVYVEYISANLRADIGRARGWCVSMQPRPVGIDEEIVRFLDIPPGLYSEPVVVPCYDVRVRYTPDGWLVVGAGGDDDRADSL